LNKLLADEATCVFIVDLINPHACGQSSFCLITGFLRLGNIAGIQLDDALRKRICL
jgi:hypothetical protein